MSATHTPHDASNVVVRDPVRGILLAFGETVPTDATAGYATGCIFIHTDGSAGTALYCNEGTSSSCDFDSVSVS